MDRFTAHFDVVINLVATFLLSYKNIVYQNIITIFAPAYHNGRHYITII